MAYLGKTREPDYLYNTDQETAEFAKLLRKRMTPCEKLLWDKKPHRFRHATHQK